MTDLPSTTVADLPAELPEGVVLLDVREDDEWAAGHAPEAVHVPMADIPARLDELPADADLQVVCKAGGRSARVVAYLQQAGRQATNVEGGMLDWQAAGRPLVSETGAEPTVI
ncbi:rhodanese-like domain-containing protein [Rhodococcus sp. X156]|uniref:rhodanese-like domain-containing protein n=1 Tax=Rhodococcus sp. X156 TaxID=2499145 RepID=UPI000FD84080|nr:rhodanese-like domain-containing protein [Rhodococcus sp. X156]